MDCLKKVPNGAIHAHPHKMSTVLISPICLLLCCRRRKKAFISPIIMFYLIFQINWPIWLRRFCSFKRKIANSLLPINRLGLRSHVLDDMPHYLQFNPWILSGYRPSDLTTMQCFKSLCYFHNETVNILSHGLPILHMISCFSPWMGSFIYHMFMNHKSGKEFYSRLLQIDMAGIWITQTFGALATLSFITQLHSVRYGFVALYLCLSVWALYKGLTALSAWQRATSFSLLVAMRVLAFVVRLCTSLPVHQWHHVHVVMQELWPILGAIISANRFPERFCPGYFDLVCNSHNIMHCLVVLGGVHMHFAFLTDIEIIYR